MGTPLGTYAFREAARDELKEMMRKTLKGGGDQHMAMRLDCKYQNHDVLWHIILTGAQPATHIACFHPHAFL